MARFVLTADFIQSLPKDSYCAVFSSIINNKNQIFIDSLGRVTNKYFSLITKNLCRDSSKLIHWLSLLGIVESHSSNQELEKGVVTVDICKEDCNEMNLFLEVSVATNNLTGMVIDDFQNTSLTVSDGCYEYKNKLIHIFDIIDMINNYCCEQSANNITINNNLYCQIANKIIRSPINGGRYECK